MPSASDQCDFCRKRAVIRKHRYWFDHVMATQVCDDHQSILDCFDADTPEEAIAIMLTRRLTREQTS